MMTHKTLTLVAALTLAGSLLLGCGRVGTLDQPAPLYGAKAKADYKAKKAAQAAAEAARREEGAPEIVSEPSTTMTPSLPAGAAPPPAPVGTPKAPTSPPESGPQ
jgi:hypothetical protein